MQTIKDQRNSMIKNSLKNFKLLKGLADDIERGVIPVIDENIINQRYIIHCIEDVMKNLTEEEREFIELKYFKNLDSYTIADKLNISIRTVYRLNKKILKKIAWRTGDIKYNTLY